MIVMSCKVQIFLPDSHSLKDKRQVLKSLKERVRSRFDVAVAEVDHHELWQRSTLGMAVVSTASRHAYDVLSGAVRFIEQDFRIHLLDYSIEQR